MLAQENGKTLKRAKYGDNVTTLKFEYDNYIMATNITSDSAPKTSWLLDSGSTVHVTNDESDLINPTSTHAQVITGGNKKLKAKSTGQVHLTDKQSGTKIILKKVLYVPEFNKKIISAGALIGNDNTLEASKDHCCIKSKRGDQALKFRKDKDTGKLYLIPEVNTTEYDTTDNKNECHVHEKGVVHMNINEFHDITGHLKKSTLKALARKIGVVLTGSLKTCPGCAMAKGGKKKQKKKASPRVTEVGQRIHIDTSGPFPSTPKGNKY